MSDPIANDYSSVTVLTPEQQYKALLTLARLDDGAAPMEGALGVHDLIDMAGLTDVANQRRHQMGLGPLRAGSPVPPIPRDSYGRARADHGPARATPETKVCGSCGSDLSEGSPNVYTNPATGKKKCKVCRQRRERERRANAKRNRPTAALVDPSLCRCAGEKHQLVTSPNGRKHCPVSTLARQRINRAKAKDARTGNAA